MTDPRIKVVVASVGAMSIVPGDIVRYIDTEEGYDTVDKTVTEFLCDTHIAQYADDILTRAAIRAIEVVDTLTIDALERIAALEKLLTDISVGYEPGRMLHTINIESANGKAFSNVRLPHQWSDFATFLEDWDNRRRALLNLPTVKDDPDNE